jgi:hypothetical protein
MIMAMTWNLLKRVTGSTPLPEATGSAFLSMEVKVGSHGFNIHDQKNKKKNWLGVIHSILDLLYHQSGAHDFSRHEDQEGVTISHTEACRKECQGTNTKATLSVSLYTCYFFSSCENK